MEHSATPVVLNRLHMHEMLHAPTKMCHVSGRRRFELLSTRSGLVDAPSFKVGRTTHLVYKCACPSYPPTSSSLHTPPATPSHNTLVLVLVQKVHHTEFCRKLSTASGCPQHRDFYVRYRRWTHNKLVVLRGHSRCVVST